MELLYPKKLCEKWINNPLYNPIIKENSTESKDLEKSSNLYKSLRKTCKELYGLEPTFTSDSSSDIKINKAQCKALRANPNINPINGRKINSKVLKGVYKELLDKCNKLNKTEKAKKERKELLGTAITESLSIFSNSQKMNNIQSRNHFAKVIRKYVDMVSPCIVSSTDKENTLSLITHTSNNDKIKDKIYFNKQIGSTSKYGIVFINTGTGDGNKLKFSAKITSDRFREEIYLLKKMSLLAEKGYSPNMPITFKVLHCKLEDIVKKEEDFGDLIPHKIIKNGNYYVILNELANGDMHDFFKKIYLQEEYESVILQLLLSLRVFHIYTRYNHNDTHLGNFLYHKIEKGGYWWYKYENLDIYVPNTGYLVILWDPGSATRISALNSEYSEIKDYKRVINLIIKMKYHNTYILKYGMKPVPEDILFPFKELLDFGIKKEGEFGGDVIMEFLKIQKSKNIFKSIIFNKNALPNSSKIINKNPYIL
jgi:hypothetical protein